MSEVYTKENTIALDGAGIIYPYVANKDWTNSYRVQVTLNDKVSVPALEKAVKEMFDLYPYFFSHIVKVKNEYRLAPGVRYDIICPDEGICRPFDLTSDKPLIRLACDGNKIGFEVFHSITDGAGAKAFIDELLLKYEKILNKNTTEYYKTNPNDDAFLTQTSDFYKDIYKYGGEEVSRFIPTSLRIGKGEKRIPLKVDKIFLDVGAFIKCAKSYNVTMTMLLCAFQICAIMEAYPDKNRKIRISVPVNIRKFYEENSCRNASLFVLIEHDPKSNMSFEELLASIKKQFGEQFTKENMQNMSYTNVKTADVPIFKILPMWLRRIVLKIGYDHLGENQFTSTLTNIGRMDVSGALGGFVRDVHFVMGTQNVNPLNLTVTSFSGVMHIVVSSSVDSSKFLDAFNKLLDKNNLFVSSDEWHK